MSIKGFDFNGVVHKYDYNALDNIPDIETDKTLTIDGAPADAKATGDRIANLQALVGSPLTASTAAGMTDHSKIYVYVGSETGYTNGNWYYYDGSAWVSGGVYNSVAVDIDTTLTLSNKAPDSKVVGDEIGELKENLDENVSELKNDLNTNVTNIEGTFETGDIELYANHDKWYHGYFDASGNLITNANNASPTNKPFLVKAGTKLTYDPNSYTGNIFVYSKSGETYTRTSVVTFTTIKVIEYTNDTYITVHFAGTAIPLNNGCHIISQTNISKDIQEMSALLLGHDSLLDTVKIQQYKDDIKLNGIVDRKSFSVNYAARETRILQLNLIKGHAYLLSAELNANAQHTVNVSLKDSNGNNLSTIYVIEGEKYATSANPYVSTNDYENAYMTITVSTYDGDVAVNYVGVTDLSTSLRPMFIPVNATVVSVVEENQSANGGVLYSAKEMTIKAKGETICSLVFYLKEFEPGQCISVHCHRNIGNNITIRILAYDETSTLIRQNSWFTQTDGDDIQYVIPENAYRVAVDLFACYGTALPADTNITFSDVSIVIASVDGIGNDGYYGELIKINDFSNKMNRCDIQNWREFKKADEPEIVNYGLSYNQSMAMYGGYVFVLQSGGTGIVLNYADKSIIGTFTFTPVEYQHANSAQFTNIFYNDNDEFPLLMVSRAGGAGSETYVPDVDECTLHRVIRNGNTFTLTAINSISYTPNGWTGDWIMDKANGDLFYLGLDNGSLNVRVNNPIVIRRFRMPKRDDILTGEPIVFTKSDELAKFTLKDGETVFQGCDCINGCLFLGIQTGNTHIATIWVIDTREGRIVSSIPLVSNREPEGVTIYNGKLYVSQKAAEDLESVNPCTIWEIDF